MIASGDIHEGIKGIRHSYTEAIDALKFMILFHGHDLVKNNKSKVITNIEVCYPIQKEKHLKDYIFLGDTGEFNQLFMT